MLPAPLAGVRLTLPLCLLYVISFYRTMLFSLVLKNTDHLYCLQGSSPNNTVFRQKFIDVGAVSEHTT